ncbi:MAG TPA: ABC transporter permease [Aggregatilinea sp.]|jgi:ABC-2 type transport system permease protein|uniref:ABC transporter permease n=1 Tax=Aggregatilinea sp. TaxID=2806333 RepID=UPI002C94E5DF|nr:ABC transporter permease [Aggregatilinea sp.]HML24092.1 ABC transporter permease [Aggregatilinea sp.]
MIQNIQIEARQSYAFVARNFNLVKRYWGWEVVWLFYSIANALSVTFIGAGASTITGQQSLDTNFLITYLLVGTLVWHFLSGIFNNVSEMIAWERWEGTIEYTFMAPVRRFNQMIGQTLFAVLYSFLFTVVIGVVVSSFFDLHFVGADFLSAAGILLVGSVSFVGIGVVASILPLLYPERGAQMTNIVQALFLLVSGVYYPVSVLPDWLQALSRLSPATYVLEGMRAALLPDQSTAAPTHYVWPLLLMGIVMLPLGVYLFQRAERYTKRTGKLKRNG